MQEAIYIESIGRISRILPYRHNYVITASFHVPDQADGISARLDPMHSHSTVRINIDLKIPHLIFVLKDMIFFPHETKPYKKNKGVCKSLTKRLIK